MMIVTKMIGDFTNFVMLYAILLFMFAIVGNINFVFDLTEFSGIFVSCLTVLDASIGNYDFEVFNAIRNNEFLVIFGDVYIMAIVVTFNILILNLIIAILSNTYNQFDTKSGGLYLSKILNARDEMAFDPNYGAFLLIMAPLNIMVLPFVPMAMIKKPSERLNTMITVLQYSFFIVIIYAVFLISSLILIPFAYLKSLINKFQMFMKASDVKEKGICLTNFLMFGALGLPLLAANLITDFIYFWKNNFRSNLKKIIIERPRSSLSSLSIRQIKDYCNRYNFQKIRSVYTSASVKSFREKFTVIQNIQFLLFGQFVQEGGQAMGNVLGLPRVNIGRMKTSNLKVYSNKVK